MANEVALSCGNKQLRADTVLYDRDLNARMIIEYKAPTIKITKRVFEQVTAYKLLATRRLSHREQWANPLLL